MVQSFDVVLMEMGMAWMPSEPALGTTGVLMVSPEFGLLKVCICGEVDNAKCIVSFVPLVLRVIPHGFE